MKKFLVLALLIIPGYMSAQNQLPYYEIPDYPDSYTATNVVARMVDGLGFRYYWATEGLRAEDLAYKPSEEARTMDETLNHILGLVNVILNSVKEQPNSGGSLTEGLDFEQKRTLTLKMIKESSDILRKSDPEKLEDFNIIFKRETSSTEYPFWNQINGPILDATWHIGQVVTFRRSAGNPITSNVSFLAGKVRK
jgi:hypothetical protein